MIETNSYKSEVLLSALNALEPGTLYYNKYAVERSQRKGVNSVIAYAALKDSPTTKVIVDASLSHFSQISALQNRERTN